MISLILSLYGFRHAKIVAYMMQSTEYQVVPYLRWYWRTQNFSHVMKRRSLDATLPARMIVLFVGCGMLLQLGTGAVLSYVGLSSGESYYLYFGLAALFSYPIVWSHLIVLPILLSDPIIIRPRIRKHLRIAEQTFAEHDGIKIAVIGSYGKTSMKEILLAVLSTGLKVAASPANKNVPLSHAHFAATLSGKEDVIIIEYGEGEPGDIARLARLTHPTYAIITGLAPAHLDKYKTLERAATDLFSIAEFVPPEQIYVNSSSSGVKPYIKPGFKTYDLEGIDDWKIRDAEVSIAGTSFRMKRGGKQVDLQSGLLGEHQMGPLGVAVSLGINFGLTQTQVKDGISATIPFAHRMQPYSLGGAWVIDDTYNGNIEGIKAGTELLRRLDATRKWYITPGLVDQGDETESIHKECGRLIAEAEPDIVVLMENSMRKHIEAGLRAEGFAGELRIEKDPLEFYLNLGSYVAAGDLVMMQNDWTDNYY